MRKALRTLPIIVLLAIFFTATLTASQVHATSALLAITFDDGYASQYMLAKPYLDSKGVTATFAIPTYNISSGVFETVTEMTWAQIQDLQSHGYEIASHGTGITVDLTATTEAVILRELNDTHDDFAGNLSTVPTSFIIPWAGQNATVRIYMSTYYRTAWSALGYSGLYDANAVMNISDSDLMTNYQWRGPRVLADPEWTNKSNEAAIITHYEAAIDELIGNQTYGNDSALVVGFHNIATACRGGVYPDMTPNVFTTVIDYGITKGCTFITLSELNSYFTWNAGSITYAITSWLPSIISLAMLGVVLGFLKKTGS